MAHPWLTLASTLDLDPGPRPWTSTLGPDSGPRLWTRPWAPTLAQGAKVSAGTGGR